MRISINLYDSVKDVDRKLAKMSDADKDWLLKKADESMDGDKLVLNLDEFNRLLRGMGEKTHFVIR